MRRQSSSRRAVRVRSAVAVGRAATAVVVGWGASAASAQTPVTWTGGTGSYVVGANWSSGTTPANAANEFLMINNGGTAQVNGANAAEGAFLNLGLQSGDVGHLEISGGSLTLGELRVGGRETIVTGTSSTFNGGGTGTVVQSGGDVNVTFSTGTEPPIQSMYVGDGGLATGNTANGSYSISAGTLTSGIADNDSIVVGSGVGATGAFVQSGGTVTSRGFLSVGRRGATGTYTFSGAGALNIGQGATLSTGPLRNLWIGDGDSDANDAAADYLTSTRGTFTQTNGVVTVGDDTINATQNVEIGRRSGTGTYDLSGTTNSQLKIPNGTLIVGGGGATTTTAASMMGNGTLHLSSGSPSVTVGDSVNDGVATNDGNRGNLNIALTASGAAAGASTIGLLDMDAGTLTLTDPNAIMAVGNGNGASGTFDISAGTMSELGASSVLDIGRNNANGTMNISGTGVVNLHQITVNSTNVVANRSLNISGGALDVDILTLGSVASAATRLVDISGGTVNIGDLTTGQATGSGSAVFWVHGGTVTLENTVQFFTGSTFRLSSIDLAVPASSTYGNGTIDVQTGSTLTLNGAFGTGATSRTLTKIGVGTVTVNGAQSYFSGAGVNVNAGTINYTSAIPNNLTVNVASGANVNFGATSTLSALTVSGTATINANGNLSLTTTGTLAVTAGGRLNIQNNHLIAKATPVGTWTGSAYTDVTGMIQSGRNGGGWGGSGIVTSQTSATTSNFTSIGVATAQQVKGLANPSDTATWAGQTVTGSDTLVMYTYGGDANLDGKINVDDYGRIDFNVNLGTAGWFNGDFNYDGKINVDDYGIIDFNVGIQGAPFFAAGGVANQGGLSAVPEPLGLSGIGVAALLLRRRRSPRRSLS